MTSRDSLTLDEQSRSSNAKRLIQSNKYDPISPYYFVESIPKVIVQFWHDLNRLPDDVRACLRTWDKIEKSGFSRLLFNDARARSFIRQRLGTKYERAYRNCYHPAMKSDYFRLCYVFLEGGCYVDTDDTYKGEGILELFGDSRLKIQPLCYDMATGRMVSTSIFTRHGADKNSWIFYFNNNPIIAAKENPLVFRALEQATVVMENCGSNVFPEIQSTTGPGILTKIIVDAISENSETENTIFIIRDWELHVETIWQLEYRHDARNWRNSNMKKYST